MNKKFISFLQAYSKFFKEKIGAIIMLITIVILGAFFACLPPLLYGKTIDSLIVSDMENTVFLITISFAISVLSSLMGGLNGKISAKISLSITNRIKCHLFDKIMKTTIQKLDSYPKGELINRLESSCDGVVAFYINLCKNIILITVNFIVSMYFILNISARLSLLSFIIMPIMFVITFLFQKKINKNQKKLVENQDKYMGFLYGTFSTIDGIKSFQIEKTIVKRFQKNLSLVYEFVNRQVNIGTALKLNQDFFISFFNLAVLYTAAILINSGILSVGELVSFIVYIEMFFTAITSIMNLSVSLHENAVNIDRINEIENSPSEANIASVNLGCNINKIKITNLSFSYVPERNVLTDIAIVINHPGWYSIVGENGCGKSTILKLLLKFYDCGPNSIYLNDIDIEKLNYSMVRSQIAYAAKDNFIISDTIENNLKIVNPALSKKEIISALETVKLNGFINSLENGYQTIIGDGGFKLSSGQTQKLMLARVILKKSTIILLDEVTSDLDAISEQEVISTIKKLAQDKIIISVAHRSSFIIPSDLIICMNNGRIVEKGIHSELLDKCGLYKKMYLKGNAIHNT